MLDAISEGFRHAKEKFQGSTILTEEKIAAAIADIRQSLLEADVEYSVAKTFLARVEEKAIGQSVKLKAGKSKSRMRVSAADHFVKICQDELEALMGPHDASLNFATNRPTVIMMVGLQGSGKTTSTGKLTRYLIETHKKKPLLVAADIYRPAAVEQLKVLGDRLGVPVYSQANATPVEICKAAVKQAFDLNRDVIILDTAGRLTIDDELMRELDNIKATSKPDNILFVCDAMMGQDAVTTAKSFNDRLDLSGVIMTKLDGDARGGAALSIRQITGKPIKFLGTGEGMEKLEEFRPQGIASRILGKGDVVGLMEDFERVTTEDHEEDAMRMLQGQFTYQDFFEQISMIKKMGSMKDLMAKLPIQGMIPKGANIDDRELGKIQSQINSMTAQERIDPKVMNPSRMKRIARGSGRSERDVQELVSKFSQMRKMMGMMGKKMGLMSKIPGLGQLSQMNQMKKMAQSMGAGGGGGLEALLGGGGAAASAGPKKVYDKDKLKKMRKMAQKARKKNRKK